MELVPIFGKELERELVTFLKELLIVCFREREANFLRCLLYYEGAFSIMEPAEFSSISL